MHKHCALGRIPVNSWVKCFETEGIRELATVRKRPKRHPSPQLYACKTEKQQELEQQKKGGLIDLYYGDERHICSEGYVPYGWQFCGEDVYISSEKRHTTFR